MAWETGYFWQLDPIIITSRNRAYARALYCWFLFGVLFILYHRRTMFFVSCILPVQLMSPKILYGLRVKHLAINWACSYRNTPPNLQAFSSSCTMYINTFSPNIFSNIQPLHSQCESARELLFTAALRWNATLLRNDLIY